MKVKRNRKLAKQLTALNVAPEIDQSWEIEHLIKPDDTILTQQELITFGINPAQIGRQIKHPMPRSGVIIVVNSKNGEVKYDEVNGEWF